MSLPSNKPNETEEKAVPSGLTITLKGRTKSHEKIQPESGNDFVQTLIVVPAKDAYSHPSTFAVNSASLLAKDGADVSVLCDLRPTSRIKDGKRYYNIQLWQSES
jgi:hypothetical protein